MKRKVTALLTALLLTLTLCVPALAWFNDTVVYFTDIQVLDSVKLDKG